MFFETVPMYYVPYECNPCKIFVQKSRLYEWWNWSNFFWLEEKKKVSFALKRRENSTCDMKFERSSKIIWSETAQETAQETTQETAQETAKEPAKEAAKKMKHRRNGLKINIRIRMYSYVYWEYADFENFWLAVHFLFEEKISQIWIEISKINLFSSISFCSKQK